MAINFLIEIINNSKNLVCFDGDLENRTYDYIKQFAVIIINLLNEKFTHKLRNVMLGMVAILN